MDHNARIESVIADLESQSRVNYAATAKKWGAELAKRHKGQAGTGEGTHFRYASTAYRCTRTSSDSPGLSLEHKKDKKTPGKMG
jgi:hypothetical protein